MNRDFFTPFRVGLLSVFAAMAFSVSLMKVTKASLSESNSFRVSAVFKDVTGLKTKSRVQIAGIEVGQVDGIELVGSRARVHLRIRNEVPLYEDATIMKRSAGFIGDIAMDIDPGDTSLPRIPDGGEFKRVIEEGGFEAALSQLEDVGREVQALTSAVLDLVTGTEGQGGIQQILDDIAQLSRTLSETVRGSTDELQSILDNLDALASSVRGFAEGEKASVGNIINNIEGITQDMQEVMVTVKSMVGANEGEVRDGVAGLRQSLDKLDQSLQEIQQVTSALAEGEGTVGRLLTDDTLYNEIEGTVTQASDFVDRLLKLQTEVALQSEYHLSQASSREVLRLRLIPRDDKWYEIALVSPHAPRGIYARETTAGGGTVMTRTETEELRINALFARRWQLGEGFSFTGRIGLIETTGGVAGELGLLGDQLSVAVELFEFSNEELPLPRMRAFVTLTFLEHLYLVGGFDNALNGVTVAPLGFDPNDPLFGQPAGSVFLGAGFRFNDEDLKAIITTVGLPGGG